MKKRKKNEGLSSVSFIITSIGFFFFHLCLIDYHWRRTDSTVPRQENNRAKQKVST